MNGTGTGAGCRRLRRGPSIRPAASATATSAPWRLREAERKANGIDLDHGAAQPGRLAARLALDRAAVRRLRPQDRAAGAAMATCEACAASAAGRPRCRRARRTGVIKVWRALWKRMAGFGYCDAGAEIRASSSPTPRRTAAGGVAREAEAVRLVKQAWRSGYHGLAALLAVAWDSQLSPVDARTPQGAPEAPRRSGDMVRGRAAPRPAARPWRRSRRRAERVLDAYLVQARAPSPWRRRRSSATGPAQPYSKDTLGDDFRGRAHHGVRRRGERASCTTSAAPARSRRSPARRAGRGLSGKMANTLVAVQPAAQDLRADAARRGARCRRCPEAR